MEFKVTKLIGVEWLQKANAFTSGKESHQSLANAYKHRHSTIRTQLFAVECLGIPQFVAYHFRTHITLHPMPPYEYGWMRSKRIDRGGADFRVVCHDLAVMATETTFDKAGLASEILQLPERFDRYAPTDFFFMISAEGLMTMMEKRLCAGAVAKETRQVAEAIKEEIKKVDSDLYPHLVRPCVRCGYCPERRCCGYIGTQDCVMSRIEYLEMYEG